MFRVDWSALPSLIREKGRLLPELCASGEFWSHVFARCYCARGRRVTDYAAHCPGCGLLIDTHGKRGALLTTLAVDDRIEAIADLLGCELPDEETRQAMAQAELTILRRRVEDRDIRKPLDAFKDAAVAIAKRYGRGIVTETQRSGRLRCHKPAIQNLSREDVAESMRKAIIANRTINLTEE